MDVARRKKFSLARGDPLLPSSGLTLRAVAIPAAVVGDGGTMPAAGALIEMAAECGSTTPRNGQQHLDVLPADPLAVLFDESSSRGKDGIGHRAGRRGRLRPPRWAGCLLRRVETD